MSYHKVSLIKHFDWTRMELIWIYIFLFLNLSVQIVKASSDLCTYKRYISSVIPQFITHENVTIYFADLSSAKDACNLIGEECTGVVLPIRRRSYILASSEELYFTREAMTWRKTCPNTCEFKLTTDYVRGRHYYRKECNPASYLEGSWLPWSSWGHCSHSCGKLGEQIRHRQCTASISRLRCTGYRYQRRICNYAKACPPTLADVFGVDGPEGYRIAGTKTIYSTCLRRQSNWGPEPCGGDQTAVTSEQCQRFDCCFFRNNSATSNGIKCYHPIRNFGSSGLITWSVWSPWSICSKSCNNGTRSRTRICTGSIPSRTPCSGTETNQEVCNLGNCPCVLNPCHNGGVCQPDEGIARGYRCDCQRNFIGKHCDYASPDLFCGNDSITVSFDRRIIPDEGLIDDMKYIHFQGFNSPRCFAKLDSDHMHYILSIPPPIDTSCGSIVNVTGDEYTIRNKVLWMLTDQSASSTVVLLDLTCTYDKKGNMTTGLGFGVLPTVRTLSTQISRSNFHISMNLFRNNQFLMNSLIRESPTIAEGEILYASVDMRPISISNPENEILVLENCYATDTTENRRPVYDFIKDGCTTNPAFTTILENGQSWQGKWGFRVFEWATQSETSDIFVVCKVYVCDSAHERCLPSCGENTMGTLPTDVNLGQDEMDDSQAALIQDLLDSFTFDTEEIGSGSRLSRTKRDSSASEKDQVNENKEARYRKRAKKGNRKRFNSYHVFVSKRLRVLRPQSGNVFSDAMMDNFYRNSLTTTSPPPPTEFTPCGLTIMVLVGCGSVIGYVIMSLIVRKLASRCEGRT
ncbi:unnamed protein product [Clavelina lepadiformis]|uniref:ZP domain-containing protein n=1 Tax=Clavelina lepadiformis TaxID=159417 RepID=A0ABP0GUM5_CLALP